MKIENKTDLFWYIFISWLKIKKIYDKFTYYYNNRGEEWSGRYFVISPILKHTTNPENWVRWAFNWGSTKEDSEFWSRIDKEWYTFVMLNKKNTSKIDNIKNRISLKNYMYKELIH
jgi:hypothetical protein